MLSDRVLPGLTYRLRARRDSGRLNMGSGFRHLPSAIRERQGQVYEANAARIDRRDYEEQ